MWDGLTQSSILLGQTWNTVLVYQILVSPVQGRHGKLKGAKWKATKMIRVLEKLTQEERLLELAVISLEKAHGDLTSLAIPAR